MKWGCLYEAAYALFGVFGPPLTFTAHRIVVRRRCMGSDGKSRENLASDRRDVVGEGVSVHHLVVKLNLVSKK
jgi:hypothetical protein